MLFVEQEVVGFVRLYSAQIDRALRWQAFTPLTLPAVEELHNMVALVHGVVRSVGHKSSVSAQLVPQAILLLQQVNGVLVSPNRLATSLRPVTSEERGLLEKDFEGTPETGPIPLVERPVMARVTLAFLQIAGVVVDMLVTYTEAPRTLTRDEIEWRVDGALIHPVSPINAGGKTLPLTRLLLSLQSESVRDNEDASIGTLFDIAETCIELMQSNPPAALGASGAAPPPLLTSTPLLPYSPALLIRNATQTLEAVLLLATTQLALWLYRYNGQSDQEKRQRITRTLAPDLVSALDRAAGAADAKYHAALKGFVLGRLVERDAEE